MPASKNGERARRPRWSLAMQRVGSGIYVDQVGGCHLEAGELLTELGWPVVPETQQALVKALTDILREHGLPVETIDEPAGQ